VVPQDRLHISSGLTVVTAIAVGAAAIFAFRERGEKKE
jgi:hypothetical protein